MKKNERERERECVCEWKREKKERKSVSARAGADQKERERERQKKNSIRASKSRGPNSNYWITKLRSKNGYKTKITKRYKNVKSMLINLALAHTHRCSTFK